MNKLITTAALALALSSTSALAFNQDNSVSWSGNSGTVEANGCKFGGQNNGVMARGTGPQANTWLTTTAATIQVRTRGNTALSVESDNVLRNADGSDTSVVATVDYTGAGGRPTQALTRTGVASVTSTSAGISNITGPLSNLHVFHLGGTATMTHANDGDLGSDNPIHWLANNANYVINHTVTCTQ